MFTLASRLTQNTTVPEAGSPHPKKKKKKKNPVPIEASYLAPIKAPGLQLNPENKIASKLRPFHPATIPPKTKMQGVFFYY